jgi:hypothetical protein
VPCRSWLRVRLVERIRQGIIRDRAMEDLRSKLRLFVAMCDLQALDAPWRPVAVATSTRPFATWNSYDKGTAAASSLPPAASSPPFEVLRSHSNTPGPGAE